jgi:hypothetical protein
VNVYATARAVLRAHDLREDAQARVLGLDGGGLHLVEGERLDVQDEAADRGAVAQQRVAPQPGDPAAYVLGGVAECLRPPQGRTPASPASSSAKSSSVKVASRTSVVSSLR